MPEFGRMGEYLDLCTHEFVVTVRNIRFYFRRQCTLVANQDFAKTTFDFSHLDKSKLKELESCQTNTLDWLKNAGLDDELVTTLVKHVTMSVLSDLVNFLYESISNAQKGKMSVAYALLRKPLTDELLIFLIESLQKKRAAPKLLSL
ncbi:hypothetical protein DF182_26565 [Chitinophaga flava]|uniref:Uncharacterized protein n=1 Tax=Chitinophaga flava TaxID=2259036 RepID=A0A365XUJ8_9BACT|nr:hypothetical protein DF182_26565 [Chitinophaga flava]